MAKRKHQETVVGAEIDMDKYVNSLPIDEKCVGCNKVFDFEYAPPNGEILIQEKKCRVYANPAAKWPAKGVKFAKHVVMVRKRDEKGKAVSLDQEELPIIDKACPLASHRLVPEIVDTNGKKRAGQQKQVRRR